MLELIINNLCFAMLYCLLIYMVEYLVDNLVESNQVLLILPLSWKHLRLKLQLMQNQRLVKLLFILKLYLLILVCLNLVTMKLTWHLSFCFELAKGPIWLGLGLTQALEASDTIRWTHPKSHWIIVWTKRSWSSSLDPIIWITPMVTLV